MEFALFGKLLNTMFFINKYKNKKEPILEPILRELRFSVAWNSLEKILNNKKSILDFGCGPEAKFYSYLCNKQFQFKVYFGFDPLSKHKNNQPKNMKLIRNQQHINKSGSNMVRISNKRINLSLFLIFLKKLKSIDTLFLKKNTKIKRAIIE